MLPLPGDDEWSCAVALASRWWRFLIKMHMDSSILLCFLMKFTKGWKSFPISRANRRVWWEELKALEQLYINCIRATPCKGTARMLMTKASVMLFMNGNWQEAKLGLRRPILTKEYWLDYETFFYRRVRSLLRIKNYVQLHVC